MRVAVIGSGAAGLGAVWLLNDFSDHEVHLFEMQHRPGGHANTVKFQTPGKSDHNPVDVDTGFIVFNPDTYPNFLRFLKLYPDLCKSITPTNMTFSVSRDNGLFEWAGKDLFSVFAQPSRFFDPSMWKMIYDILRFNATATRILIYPPRAQQTEISIGEYLQREGYSDAFRDNYLLPMTAAIWSTPPDKCSLDFPARTLIQFMVNHRLLQVTGKPLWLTLRGGSHCYVNQIIERIPKNHCHLGTKVEALGIDPATLKPYLQTSEGRTEIFDHVICAGHSDETLNLLRAGGSITPQEEKILGSFQWSRNEAVFHSDVKLMPANRVAWSSWNYLTESVVSCGKRKVNINQVSLTYWMNELQHLPEKDHGVILVTLNPLHKPAPDRVVGCFEYSHPVLDTNAIRAQQEIHVIQGVRGISFAGAWLKYGFHEDAFTSGLLAASSLQSSPEGSVRPPFEILSADDTPTVPLAARFFDIFELSGLRMLAGLVLGSFLGVTRMLLELAFRADLQLSSET